MKRIGVLCVLVWGLAGLSGTAWSCNLAAGSMTEDSLVTPVGKPAPLTHRRAIVDDRVGPMILLHAIIVSPKWSEIIQAPRVRLTPPRHRIDTFSAAWRT